MRIELEDGKYTYVLHEDGRQHALRYGEIWRDLVGDKFVFCLAARCEELRAERDKLREAFTVGEAYWRAPLGALAAALGTLLAEYELECAPDGLFTSHQESVIASARAAVELKRPDPVKDQLIRALHLVRVNAPIDGLHIGDEQYLDTIVDEALIAAGETL